MPEHRAVRKVDGNIRAGNIQMCIRIAAQHLPEGIQKLRPTLAMPIYSNEQNPLITVTGVVGRTAMGDINIAPRVDAFNLARRNVVKLGQIRSDIGAASENNSCVLIRLPLERNPF